MDIELKQGYREPTGESSSNGQEYKRVYVVTNSDTSNDMEYRMINHPDMPKRGDSYSADPNYRVDKVAVSLQEEDNYLQWEAEVTYKIPDEDNGGSTSDTWQRNLQVSARPQQYENAFEMAYNSENEQFASEDDDDNGFKKGDVLIPVLSTSNEPLATTTYDANILIEISQNVSRFDFNWIKEFKNSTNAKEAKIVGIDVAEGQARIVDISGVSQIDATGDTYYSTNLSIEITDKDFLVRLMNKGRMKKLAQSAGTDPTEPILNGDVAPDSTDKEWKKLEVDEPVRLTLENEPIPFKTKGAFYVAFKANKSLDWGVLDIPTYQPT